MINLIKINPKIIEATNARKIILLKETPLYNLFRIFLEEDYLLENIDEESYLFEFEETAKMFEEFFDETYLSFNKKENSLIIEVVTTNLAKRIKEMSDKNKILIFMSGTLHSPEVLRDIFGINNFKIINAETEQPGKATIIKKRKQN